MMSGGLFSARVIVARLEAYPCGGAVSARLRPFVLKAFVSAGKWKDTMEYYTATD